MRPYMDGKYMVHAMATLPGGFRSRVASLPTPQGVKYFHVIQDELTHEDDPEGKDGQYRHVRKSQWGPYRMYTSYKASDLTEYLKAHRAAVELWTELYMFDGVGTAEEAGELAAANARAYYASSTRQGE